MPCVSANLGPALFGTLTDYPSYLERYPLHETLGVDLNAYGSIAEKVEKTAMESVDPSRTTPFAAELDDLIRLHHLVVSRKVTTVLEFGVGKSTAVFGLALEVNRIEFNPPTDLRRANLHECHSVDNNAEWIEVCRDMKLSERVSLHHSECQMTTLGGRICTLYESLPNVCPDLIYVDGPDQFSPVGEIRGVSTRSVDRVPMAGDLLPIEHFLLPGTLIVLDGRTANARFLASNLQRNWVHWHSTEFDQHFFELVEPPLGRINSDQLDYCLGEGYLERVNHWG